MNCNWKICLIPFTRSSIDAAEHRLIPVILIEKLLVKLVQSCQKNNLFVIVISVRKLSTIGTLLVNILVCKLNGNLSFNIELITINQQ